LFDRFERLVDPFPVAESGPPPTRFWPFLWQATQGVRRYIAGMTLFTAIIGVFEAWLFSLLGKLVDWLAGIPPAELWAREGTPCWRWGPCWPPARWPWRCRPCSSTRRWRATSRCACAGTSTA
jgi:hypothetical protein